MQMNNAEMLKRAKDTPVTVYWWNFGTRKLDYKGTYQGLMDTKDIKVEEIEQPFMVGNREYTKRGLRFTISVSSAKSIFEIWGNEYERSFHEAIVIFLVMMGDKATVRGSRWESKVNW